MLVACQIGRNAPKAQSLNVAVRTFFNFSKRQSFFDEVDDPVKDPAHVIQERFNADPNPKKVVLEAAGYLDDEGKPLLFDSVKEAQQRIGGSYPLTYSQLDGQKGFLSEAVKLAFGANNTNIKPGTVAAVQVMGSIGGCRLFAEFQRLYIRNTRAFVALPTWTGHHVAWRESYVQQGLYRYFNVRNQGLDFESMMDDVQGAPQGSVFVFQACGHNPTGLDLSPDQWRLLSKAVMERKHFPFFDLSYQGLVSGDVDTDAQAVRIFLEDGHQLAVMQTFADSMGLAGQAVGCLSVVCDSTAEATAVEGQLRRISSSMYPAPPAHVALLAHAVLSDPELKAKWQQELSAMTSRLVGVRRTLQTLLQEEHKSTWTWKHLTAQGGLYSYTGLTASMVDDLGRKHGVYMMPSGRMSVPAINSGNIEQVAAALAGVTKGRQQFPL